eukprot:GAHX01001687.1.p1 GENE.GAHX01001687.1~~GAHX01001687.1.p1  ORF type:complete len:553 (-),score=101.89 GAHX01001687.1:85-1743(-)
MTKNLQIAEDKPAKHYFHPFRIPKFTEESENSDSYDEELTTTILTSFLSSIEIDFPDSPPIGKITNSAGRKLPFCKYYMAGFCNKGTACPFRHDIIYYPQSSAERLAEFDMRKHDILKGRSMSDPVGRLPNSDLKKRHSRPDPTAIQRISKENFLKTKRASYDISSVPQTPRVRNNTHKDQPILCPASFESPKRMSSQENVFAKTEIPANVKKFIDGYMYTNDIVPILDNLLLISRDQNGCRFLQSLLKQTNEETFSVVLNYLLDNFPEIATNAFGNYLCQKIIEIISMEDLWLIVKMIEDNIFFYALDMHGTRVLQKLITRLLEENNIDNFLVNNIRGNVNVLAKNINANHIIQKILTEELAKKEKFFFIFDEICLSFVEVATHKNGCCVLQRCIDSAPIFYRKKIAHLTVHHIYELIQNAYGNYVVQYMVEHSGLDVVPGIMATIQGNLVELSKQKFSSNAIEKLLSLAGDREKISVINELVESGCLRELLEDSYANYVIQKAVAVCDKKRQRQLVMAIKSSCDGLGYDSLGKKVCNKIIKKYEMSKSGY